MNYYGYTSGYGVSPYQYPYTSCMEYNSCRGNSVAIILVLFILLVVVFGAGFLNTNNFNNQ